jgi:hypothetical protein
MSALLNIVVLALISQCTLHRNQSTFCKYFVAMKLFHLRYLLNLNHKRFILVGMAACSSGEVNYHRQTVKKREIT